MWTDPLVLSVLQPYGVVGHAQHREEEVDQSKDAVEPQKVVPERHTKTKTEPDSWDSGLVPRHPTTPVQGETHSAPTLASVVLPKFWGLSPVGKNAT